MINPEDDDYEEALDEIFDYDPEYDRACSYPCEICGEEWEGFSEETQDYMDDEEEDDS